MLNILGGDHDSFGTHYNDPDYQTCPQCGKLIAAAASVCLHCGHGLPPELQGVPG